MPLNKEADLKLLVTLAMDKPKAFVYENNVSAGAKWDIWLGQLQSYLKSCGVESEIQMIGIHFNFAGERVWEIYKTSAAAKDDDDDFKAVVKILTDHFDWNQNQLKCIWRFCFTIWDSRNKSH